MRASLLLVLLVLAYAALRGKAAPVVTYGEPQEILTDHGRQSFGNVLSVDVVAWSAPDAQDLLVGRCWQGLFLYPSRDLQHFGPPLQLCDMVGHNLLLGEPAEWAGKGKPGVIGSDRRGFIFRLALEGGYPQLRLAAAGDLLLAPAGVPYNIPFDNPYQAATDKGGRVDAAYHNYVYPTAYPGGLVIGDTAGRLWWLPCRQTAKGWVCEIGERYTKADGKEFAKPVMLRDEQGQPFLLGDGVEDGHAYEGGVTKPVTWQHDTSGADDLLVWCGMNRKVLLYLERTGARDGVPVFRNRGEVPLRDRPAGPADSFGYHSAVAVVPRPGGGDLLISSGGHLALFRNLQLRDLQVDGKPTLVFSHWLTGEDVPTQGYNYTEVLTGPRGRRYLLENNTTWFFREIMLKKGQLRLSAALNPLRDQHGIFRVEAETDPNFSATWGLHRAALWDFDGSGRQHLIVGTDKGLLYLLRQDRPLGEGGRFEFASYGPLKDTAGDVIRIHSRVVAAPLDLDGDGRLDLVLAGATYQLGAKTDPHPGGGLYYALNRGLDSEGWPILDPPQPLATIGHTHTIERNRMVQLQTLDLLGKGERLLIVATQDNWCSPAYVYRPAKGRIALDWTGIEVPLLSIQHRLLDLDGDGRWEFVKSGGESLIGTYAPVSIVPAAGDQR